MARVFERFVALGDSTTEGLDDPDGTGGYRGWANRLAEIIAAQQGRLRYANLAVRGRRAFEIRAEQLERAVALAPDLATVVAGTNDVLRPRFDAEGVGAEIGAMQHALLQGGATVLTFTLPDLSRVIPAGRLLAVRVRALNDALRAVSRESGAVLVDVASYDVASDPRLWSRDRLHANSHGHERIAAALAHALELPGSDRSWADPLAAEYESPFLERLVEDMAWGREHLLPWVARRARGTSTGHGRRCKHPEFISLPAIDSAS
ncbi:MAG: SGNH/GDSL hydrolase family protein [Gemmatimonadaceae bacterium]